MRKYALYLAVLALTAGGCEGLNKATRNMDMASERVNPQKPVYEGTLDSMKRVGALYALQFQDGQAFEVVECPATLVHGDIVRIYKLDKGFVAHLWKEAPAQIPPGVLPATTPAPGLTKSPQK